MSKVKGIESDVHVHFLHKRSLKLLIKNIWENVRYFFIKNRWTNSTKTTKTDFKKNEIKFNQTNNFSEWTAAGKLYITEKSDL